MNVKYKFHPPECALGETEKFYSDMETKGWRLKKRGAYLSKFTRAEPSAARYRVEIVVPPILDQSEMPEEQIAVYADCGWEYVADHGPVYIFRAQEDSDAPEFYTDPRQQAEVLKKWKRRDRWGWLIVALVLGFQVLMAWSLGGSWAEFRAELMRSWVEHTALFLLCMAILLGALTEGVYGDWKFGQLYRSLKKGVPMDHEPKGRGLEYFVPVWIFRGLTALFALLTVVQWIGVETYELPRFTDGPYVLLEGLGYEGERTENWVNHTPSQVRHSRSLLAEQWDVEEFLGGGDGTDFYQIWMYQDVYRLSPVVSPEKFARTLMEDAVFARGAEDFRPVEIEGLDAAWTAGMELVTIRGRYVFYVQHLPSNRMAQEQIFEQILAAIADLKI